MAETLGEKLTALVMSFVLLWGICIGFLSSSPTTSRQGKDDMYFRHKGDIRQEYIRQGDKLISLDSTDSSRALHNRNLLRVTDSI